LPPSIAPIKCSVLPISANKRLDPIVQAVREELTSREISSKIVNFILFVKRVFDRTIALVRLEGAMHVLMKLVAFLKVLI
jgi:hypothetical protein